LQVVFFCARLGLVKFFRKTEDIRQEAVVEELRGLIAASGMPEDIAKIALEEVETLSRIVPSSAEYTIGLTYIDYLVGMPWRKKTEDNLDISRAASILDEEHHGLKETKERIMEHLAVKTLAMRRKARVLVVDDEEIARKNLAVVLAKEGYDVITAESGSEALQVAASGEVDAILTDLKMAGMDGIEVMERIGVKYPDTRVIIITGYATVQSAISAMKKGAFSYISKPYRLDEVRSAVREALESKLAVRGSRGSVLCFAGPPGTGKTSVGRAIARALDRKFVRISLAGIRDEAEIRGHRRTYAGAMPGRIIEEIHRVESSNPVMMLDEIDKLGHDFKGDPSSALLEVLDIEQNHCFVDHYLGVPFDLSGVMFILTANVIDTVPAPLRDRMEVIEFTGFTQEEKLYIASHFIVPKQAREKGLYTSAPVLTDEAILKIIQDYTDEAGIRGLERRVAAICRKMARETVEGRSSVPATIDADSVENYLGKRKYHHEVVEARDCVGVATGLVRTPAGGEVIFVEAAKMKGGKELIITGSLGDVMRESAQTALSYIRSNAGSLGISDDFFEQTDIHIHVPAGAIQKDGPSAGLTIAMALISLLTARPARRDVALSGEITLTGRILPVGSIREKVLAARRGRVKKVLLPLRNQADVEELSLDLLPDIEIEMVDQIADVVERVLTPPSRMSSV
jgi:ATP-dependent Lon protease